MNTLELWIRLIAGAGLILTNGFFVGMVTVTDCLESVMGDIEDPIDTELPPLAHRSPADQPVGS